MLEQPYPLNTDRFRGNRTYGIPIADYFADQVGMPDS
jgi:hypothetical protein